eukprot:COSAG06_NODE_26122_length_621_cov_0.731801_1_plen_192_part_01
MDSGGRAGVVDYGPDSDNDVKLRYDDGSRSGYLRVDKLSFPGAYATGMEPPLKLQYAPAETNDEGAAVMYSTSSNAWCCGRFVGLAALRGGYCDGGGDKYSRRQCAACKRFAQCASTADADDSADASMVAHYNCTSAEPRSLDIKQQQPTERYKFTRRSFRQHQRQHRFWQLDKLATERAEQECKDDARAAE